MKSIVSKVYIVNDDKGVAYPICVAYNSIHEMNDFHNMLVNLKKDRDKYRKYYKIFHALCAVSIVMNILYITIM